ncbi:MAG TPA: hypothetical protein EYN91_17950 [Candidatus Melainabacteria bacterium]|jgi:hypothetical protein|nr:hypothetical protein [Candidatus Melainabacteria bacterium]
MRTHVSMGLLLVLVVGCNNSSVRRPECSTAPQLAVGEHHGDGNDEDADDDPCGHGCSPELEVVCSNTDAPISQSST